MSTEKAFDPTPAAELLASTWRRGGQIVELPAEVRPATMAQGYALQDRFLAAMDDPLAGWKLGVGSPAQMRASGLGVPLVGRVLRSRLHRSGDTVHVPAGDTPITLEFEIAFVLGRDVQPDERIADPLEVAASACVTYELVRSRFVNRLAVGWPSFAGDGVGFEALVVGDTLDDGARLTPARVAAIARSVTVEQDGQVAARGLEGEACTDPIASLGALLAHAREFGLTLRRGEIVTTGVVAKPFDFRGESDFVARYEGGELRARVQRGA